MATNTTDTAVMKEGAECSSTGKSPGAAERRRRRRAKLSAPVRLRSLSVHDAFEEVCTTVDVSRDGLLVATNHSGYWKGQALSVIFPYSDAAGALNQERRAEIVRVTQGSGGKFIAVCFLPTAEEAARAASVRSVSSATHSNVPGRPSGAAEKRWQPAVLAVEPDPGSTQNLRHVLEDDGYAVVIVRSAKEALEVLKSMVPAVVIADVELEEISGHDLCLIIKGNERLQKVPVVLLTRSGTPADYAASHKLGAVVCMAKPLKTDRLRHVIHLLAPPPARRSIYDKRALRTDYAL